MAFNGLLEVIDKKLAKLQAEGLAKGSEKVICEVVPAAAGKGSRYRLAGYGDRRFLRMNSNSYLGFSRHPEVIAAAETAARRFGCGPGAVRFISGTCQPHIELEKELARFHGRDACMLFSAAYAAVLGLLPQLITPETMVLSDALNHNSIINALRLAGPAKKAVYRHLDMGDLESRIKECVGKARRLLVVSDGIFSMRGDFVPLSELVEICRRYEEHFVEGIVTVVDDSHGIGALGESGRGVEEFCRVQADILVATLGKALGVNGGYVVAPQTIIDYLRESAPFYIYSNPLSPAEAAAALAALRLLESPEGLESLNRMRSLARRFAAGVTALGYEIIPGPHPIVPLMIRDSQKTTALVEYLLAHDILATGLNYPVVPRGDEEIRFQITASHTETDIDQVLNVLKDFGVP